MNKSSNNNNFECNRRGFLKIAGIGAAAVSIPGMGLISNAGAAAMDKVKQDIVETEVLVLGGGFAGAFAAIKAKENGVDVTIVDKGHVGKSGLSPFARGFSTFNKSQDMKQFQADVSKYGHYLSNQKYTKVFAEHSGACGDDLIAWGADGITKFGDVLRKQIEKNNIRIIERTMVTDLIKQNGRITGAVGFPMEEDKAIVIKAKAVILCTGEGAFKPAGFPSSTNTSDGESMAFRAGAEITGKEFMDCHTTSITNPAGYYIHSIADWNGTENFNVRPGARAMGFGMDHTTALTFHNEGGPIKMGPPPGERPDGRPDSPPGGMPPGGPPGGSPRGGPKYDDPRITIGASAGLSGHKTAGVWPVDENGFSGVPGLYAAGDALGSMMCGAFYCVGGGSSSGSAAQGVVAGIAAAKYAKTAKKPAISKSELNKITTDIFAPRERDKGYSPAWVTQMLQNTVIPYYALFIKSEKRLKAALSNIEFYRDHFLPKLIAKDTHELRLVHETRNMMLNAEMKIRASLYRTESRGTHYREDFPEKDNKNWLAWIKIKQDKDGSMTLSKESVPKEWGPA